MGRDKPGKRKPAQKLAVATERADESKHRVTISLRQQRVAPVQSSATVQNAVSSQQLLDPSTSQLQSGANPPPFNTTAAYVQPISVPSAKQLKQTRSKNAEKFDSPLFLYDIEKWQDENGIKDSLKPGQTLEDVPGATRKNPNINDVYYIPNGVWIQYPFTDQDGKIFEDADKPFPLFLPPCNYASRVPGTDKWEWKVRTANDPPSTWTWEEYREYLDLWGMPVELFYAHRNGRTSLLDDSRAVEYPEPDPRGPYLLHPSQWELLEDELANLEPTKHSIMVKNFPYQIRSKPEPADPSECRIVKEESWRKWPWRSVTSKRVARSSEEAIANGQKQDLAIEASLSGSISQFHAPNEPVYHTRLEIADKNQEYVRLLASDPTVVVNPSTQFDRRSRKGRFEYILPLDAWFAQMKFTSQYGSSITAEQLFCLTQNNKEYLRMVQESNVQIVWIPAGASIDDTHHINIDLNHELQQEEVMKYPVNPGPVSSSERSIFEQGKRLGDDLADDASDEDAIAEQPAPEGNEDNEMDESYGEDHALQASHNTTNQKSNTKDEEAKRAFVIVGVEDPEKFQVCGTYYPQIEGFDWNDKEHIARLNRWRQQTYRRKIGRKSGPKTHYGKAELHYLERFYQHFGKEFYAKDLEKNFNKHLNYSATKRTVYSIEERLKRLVRDREGKESRSNIRMNPVIPHDANNNAYDKKLRAWEKEWKTTVQKECAKLARTENKMNPGRKRAHEAEDDVTQTPTPGKKREGATSTRGHTNKNINDTAMTGYNSATTGATVEKDSSEGASSTLRPPPLPSDYYGGDGVTPRWKYIKSPRDSQGRVIGIQVPATETAANDDMSKEADVVNKNDNGAALPDYESSDDENTADDKDDTSVNNTDAESDGGHPDSEGEPEIDDSYDP